MSLLMSSRLGPCMALLALLLGCCLPLWAQTGTATAVAPAAAQGNAPAAARQRLALVVGIGSAGSRVVLESARRDSQAVAAALRAGGYQVLLREDVNTADLRAALKQFRELLRADGIGLIYYTGLAAQVDGRNLLLPSDVALNDAQAPSGVAALLRAVGVPLQEAADALSGSPDTPRALIVDAAYRHPTLARLTPPGLARPRLAAGTMALLGHAPAALQDPPTVQPLDQPAADPQQAAASRFARVLVEALGTPRISVPEALRAIRLAVVDGSGGLTQPWLGGDTFGREYLADAARLENPRAAATAAAPAPTPAAVPVAVPVATPAVPPPAAPVAPPVAASASAPSRPAPTGGLTAQAPGRGERPVYQARANSFGHAEGDTLSYQVLDTRKDEVLRSYTVSIDEVRPDGLLSANGGLWQMDAQGRLKRQRAEDGTQSSYEPAQEIWWAKPQAGETRPAAFKETVLRADQSVLQIEWKGSSQVGTLRVVETPAGEFEVLPIKTTGQSTQTAAGAPALAGLFTRTVFYAPKLGVPVLIEIEDNDAQGRPLRRERIELTHAQQARTAN